jgi:transglutaminase-like putative cysteine protease
MLFSLGVCAMKIVSVLSYWSYAFLGLFALILISPQLVLAQSSHGSGSAKSREFIFTYGATVKGLKPGQVAMIWIPIPPTTNYQKVKVIATRLPGDVSETREPIYGNEVFFIQAKADAQGQVPFEVTYHVLRREAKGENNDGGQKVDTHFLQADRLVPLTGKPRTLLAGKKLPQDQLQLGKQLYDIVNNHMEYKKVGTGWGRGDAEWACGSGYGNCTDFHSLFISLARSEKIPAKFEIGFPLPEKHGQGTIPGYHCWAWFKPAGHGWLPVDISAANQLKENNPKMVDYYFGNLTPDRVVFTTGRDLNLVPRQKGEPLNFLIYPYVEVDGQPYPAANIANHFGYRDVGPAR